MKFSRFFLVGFAFLNLLLVFKMEAGFANTGRMQSRNLNINVNGTLDNNGELIGTDSARLSCDTFTGKGVVCSPQITIQTKVFAYTGVIDCSSKCTITTTTPFDQKMFKRKGKGEFIIILDENGGPKAESNLPELEPELPYEVSAE